MQSSTLSYTFQTKSNLSLNPGDAVIMLTNGSLDVALLASTAIFGVCQTKVTAIAATRQNVQVIPALEGILWEAQYGITKTTLGTNLGANRDIGGGTGVMVLTSTSGGGAPARLIGLAPGPVNTVGQYMRVLFT